MVDCQFRNCCVKDIFFPLVISGDVAKSEFVFRYSDNVADYKLLDTGNRVVDYPLTPAVNDSFTTRLLVEFACRNSEDKSRGKVERVLRFELYRRCPTTEQPLDDVLLGVAEIKVRVCASPMRDYEKDKAKAKPPMPGRSGVGSSGWKMSLPESEVLFCCCFIFHFLNFHIFMGLVLKGCN